MQSTNSIVDVGTLTQDARHGPLPLLLIVLTVVTGLVDAVSYLKLGHVFVANMTGNVVLLGLAAGGVSEFSVAVSLVAMGSFLLGALAAGRLGSSTGEHRGRFLALATYAQVSVVGAAFVVSLTSSDVGGGILAYTLVVLLAFAMGLQNAAARRLGVPDLTTTVLTLTFTGLAADSHFAGGANPNIGRRLVAIAAMFIGASLGAALVFRIGVSAVLAVAVALLLINAVAGYWLSSSTAAWTAAK
ncbi:MAG TPA: YoaK family protein [Vicinamibacterales bacterium]|nr:YoaK family protein [Vicinamibacterales bacterium]